MEGPRIEMRDPSSVGLSGERLHRIDTFVQNLVDTGVRPNGMVLVARHGQPVYLQTVGNQNDGTKWSLADRELKLRQDSIFRIYSMTKPITSVALMMLYEQGAFQLTDPVFLYLGEAWNKSNMTVWKSGLLKDGNMKIHACTNNILMLHVLTHTSGLSYGFDDTGSNPVDAVYHKEGIVGFGRSLEEWVGKLATLPLLFQPGSCWHYGYNTDVCGMLVEAISGMPFSQFMATHILNPLGMVDTAFWVPPEKRHRFCDNFFELPRSFGSQAKLMNISKKPSQLGYIGEAPPLFSSGGGGLVSTMYDYFRFCQCILNGGELDGVRLLSVKTVEWMAANHLPHGKDIADMPPPLPGTYSESKSHGEGFGLGFSVKTNNTVGRVIGSDGILMWGGAANTVFWLDPKEQAICIWMTQTMGYDMVGDPVRSKLRQLVYAAIVDRKPFQDKARL